MDVKNKRGMLYVLGLVLLFGAILGITRCSDSSAYTLNPEYYNVRFIIPVVVLAFAGLMVYLKSRDK